MARSIAKQTVSGESATAGRSRNAVSSSGSGRTRQAAVFPGQPSFISELSRRSGRSRISILIADVQRSGDIRVEDIRPQSIKTVHIKNAAITNAKINDLSADKITTGTLDAGIVTISSDDGKMTMINNIFQIKDGSDVIQVTIGKYDGTNYGMVTGTDPGNPGVLINENGITINTADFIKMKSGSTLLFQDSVDTLNARIGFVIDQFKIVTTSAKGTVIANNLTLGDSFNPSYGGGNEVFFLNNAQVVPSSNPSNGGIVYTEAGALKYRGSGGTTTTVAAA